MQLVKNDGSIAFVRLRSGCGQRLAEIDQECNRPPWSSKMFEDEFPLGHSLTFGVLRSNEILGFLTVHTTAEEAHIVNFGISKEHRQQGLGRSLLDHVLHFLYHRGVRWVTLEVRKSNLAGRAIYDSFGFSYVGTRERYYSDDREDAVVMSLTVSSYVDSLPPQSAAAGNG